MNGVASRKVLRVSTSSDVRCSGHAVRAEG